MNNDSLKLTVRLDTSKISDDLKKIEQQLNAKGSKGTDSLSHALNKLSNSAVALVTSRLKASVSELKEIDTYLTEIRKANAALSKSDLVKIGNDSFEAASRYGKSASAYLSALQEASRAGYKNAKGIAELSVAAQSAGGITQELADQYITATDNAYKLSGSVEKLTEVLDGSTSITSHNAVNMEELAEGMSVASSTAASLGVEVNETTAALGTMIATTKESGSEAARAYEEILLNIRQVVDEEKGISSEGLAKYEEACNALGVSLKETRNGILEMRDPMKVLEELAEAYNKLDANDSRKTALLDAIGSSSGATHLDALLSQWDTYEKMLQEYAAGGGSLVSEAEKIANSWEGSLTRLSNTWTDTVGNVANSDAIITIIDGLNGLLSVLNNVTDAMGPLGSIATIVGGAIGTKGLGYAIYP